MPKGMFLIGWDNTVGSIVEAKFPPKITIDNDRILHYLMTIQTLATTNIIQVQDEKENVLIYGIPKSPTNVDQGFNYIFIVLLLNEDESEKTGQFKLLLNSEGKKIVFAPRFDRQRLFSVFAHSLLQPPSHKIVFMGFPNAGKTSTKNLLFNKMREEQILNTTNEPTLGFETNYYHLMDLNLALFDTSGQELDRWFDLNEPVLEGSDMVVFFFSTQDWNENKQKVKDYLRKLDQLRKEKHVNCKNIVAFCHKFDLIRENEAYFKKEVIESLQSLKIPIFFTSILNGGNDDLITGMQLLLVNYSRLLTGFNSLINPLLQQFGLDPLFMLDSNYRELARLIGETDLPEDHQVQLKEYGRNLLVKHMQTFQDHLEFSTIWIKSIQTFLITINFSVIHPELSYLFCKTGSLHRVTDFFKAYQDFINSFKWQQIQH